MSVASDRGAGPSPPGCHWRSPSRLSCFRSTSTGPTAVGGFDLRDRRQRSLVHERVVREGLAVDVLTYIDGALLVDLWDELVLAAGVRAAWGHVVCGEARGRC